MEKEKIYLITDASKQVEVESHVLRYWEDELKLPVKRNELGHRYYTEEDIMEFREIKKLKEQGLQLKAIRMILKNGVLTKLPEWGEKMMPVTKADAILEKEAEEKAKRLEYLMKRLIAEAVQESNEKFYKELTETLTKELDYQFRMQEERDEQRENRQMLLEEEHYKQLDALLRSMNGRKKERKRLFGRKKEEAKET